MKKVLFTTLSIIAVAAMMMVSCKKEPVEKPDDNKEEQKPEDDPKVDEDLVGTWTIVGEANGWNEKEGVAMTENNNVWTVAEVAVKGEGFKFVKDAAWTINLGASPKTGATQKFDDDVEFDLQKDGDNIAGAKDGIYSVTLNLLTKKAKIAFVKDLEPEGNDPIVAKTWAEAEEAGAIHFFQYYAATDWGNPNVPPTEADSFDNLTVENGVYTLDATLGSPEIGNIWNSQLFLRPNPAKATLPLVAEKKYLVSITIKSTAEITPEIHFTAYNPEPNNDPNSELYKKHEGEMFKIWNGVKLDANVAHTYSAIITGKACDNINWTLGLGGHSGATVEISDIVVEEFGIKIDGNMAEWDGVTTGLTHEGGAYVAFKVAADSENLYFYTKRDATRIGDIWGKNGYIYYCLDTDNNAETGDGTLWGNGPFEAVMAIFAFDGTMDAPEFGFFGDTTIMPATCTLANAKIAGKVVADTSVEIEVSIPRADLPAIPSGEFSIVTWGNKGADDAHQKWTGTL